MQQTLNRLRIIFLSVFALGVIATWTWQIGWAGPRARCEARHDWWSDEYRTCAHPVSLSTFTGKPNPTTGVEAKPVTAHPNPLLKP